MTTTTIAQQLKIKEFPFEIKNSKGNSIYYETSDGFWYRRELDSNGNEIYLENSCGYWTKSEFDSNGNRIYYESSNGLILDKRSENSKTELTLDEIAEKFGIPVSQLKIKK